MQKWRRRSRTGFQNCIISEINSKAGDDMEKSRFIEFEIARCKVKIEELKKRIRQKDSNIHSMEIAKQQVNTCLKSYSKGKNPRLPVQKYIRGLFFDLRKYHLTLNLPSILPAYNASAGRKSAGSTIGW